MYLKTNTRLCGTLAIVLFAAACAEPVTPSVTSPDFTNVVGTRAALASSERSQIFPSSFTNPCNGEEVFGTAIYHTVTFFNDTPAGQTIRTTFRMNFEGIGSLGNRYTGQLATSEGLKFMYTGGMATAYGVDVHVVSKGHAPNFTARLDFGFRIDDNGNITTSSEKVSERCK